MPIDYETLAALSGKLDEQHRVIHLDIRSIYQKIDETSEEWRKSIQSLAVSQAAFQANHLSHVNQDVLDFAAVRADIAESRGSRRGWLQLLVASLFGGISGWAANYFTRPG